MPVEKRAQPVDGIFGSPEGLLHLIPAVHVRFQSRETFAQFFEFACNAHVERRGFRVMSG